MSTRTQIKHKLEQKARRHARVRARIFGTAKVPRLCVSRSNRYISAQLIDDAKGITLAVSRDQKMAKSAKKAAAGELSGKQAAAFTVGREIAQKAQELKIKKAVFDRGACRYHGRIKSLAEGARKGGLEF